MVDITRNGSFQPFGFGRRVFDGAAFVIERRFFDDDNATDADSRASGDTLQLH